MKARWFICLVVAALTASGSAAAGSMEDAFIVEGPGSVPRAAMDTALSSFQEYGAVADIEIEASTSLAYWNRVEPSNTSGLGVDSSDADSPVYTLFATGTFEVTGPVTSVGQSVTSYGAARLVFDDSGEILLVMLRSTDIPSDPPFGAHLDDR